MNEPKPKRPAFEKLMLFLNIVALLGLILAYAGGSISPQQFWPIAFFSMAYPAILVCVFLFTFYWLVKRKAFLFVNVAFLAFQWNYVSATVKLFSSSEVDSNSNQIKVMTYNVRLFDRYNWTEKEGTEEKIKAFIASENADILCIQEYYNPNGLDLNLLGENKQLGFHQKNYFPQRGNKNDFGIVIISKFPMINKGTIVLENSRDALTIFSDLVIDSDTVRVYNVHLQSLNLGIKGYHVLDELVDSQELENMNEGKLLLSRMKRGFLKRSIQADKIAKHISESPYPVLVCGDFNDTPTSYSYQQIANGLNDAFAESGSGFGFTYVKVPFFRIDNVLYSDEFSSNSHKVHSEHELSDHFAVTANLTFRD